MTGKMYMIVGILIIVVATLGFVAAELLVQKKKKICESTYQIYE